MVLMYFMHNVVYMIIMVCLIIVFMFLANCIFKIVKLIIKHYIKLYHTVIIHNHHAALYAILLLYKYVYTHTPIPLKDLCMNNILLYTHTQ